MLPGDLVNWLQALPQLWHFQRLGFSHVLPLKPRQSCCKRHALLIALQTFISYQTLTNLQSYCFVNHAEAQSPSKGGCRSFMRPILEAGLPLCFTSTSLLQNGRGMFSDLECTGEFTKTPRTLSPGRQSFLQIAGQGRDQLLLASMLTESAPNTRE